MTSLRLDPPASFDFTRPDEWPRWKCRFQQFQVASGLASESKERQVSTLLYCMGEAAEPQQEYRPKAKRSLKL